MRMYRLEETVCGHLSHKENNANSETLEWIAYPDSSALYGSKPLRVLAVIRAVIERDFDKTSANLIQ
jgi:hypothetical protein